MQPSFNIKREKTDDLLYTKYENDHCIFQFHSQIEVYMIDDGEMEMFVDRQFRILRKGEISVALSYDTHAYKTPAFSRSSAIFIPTQLCEEFLNATKGKRLRTPFISNQAVYQQIKHYCAALEDEGISHIRKIGHMYAILGAIFEYAEFEDADSPISTDLASKILFYIGNHFKDPITPQSIAKHFGYNPCYISRYFKACCGITMVKYLSAVRLKNALLLIHENRHDMSYCALESGFASTRTFYRVFREEFNCSPHEYLHQYKETPDSV